MGWVNIIFSTWTSGWGVLLNSLRKFAFRKRPGISLHVKQTSASQGTLCCTKSVMLFQYMYPTRCKFTQFIYIWKLLYMFRVLLPPIIRSTYNCIYSIWYLSHCYCYLPLAAGSSNGVTNTRCCRYSCMRS